MIPIIHSIKTVERQYSTGEEPILVLCSDRNEYICKYARTHGAAYKLVSELLGSHFAQIWGLNTPLTAFVNIMPSHWTKAREQSTLAFGSRRMESVIDITPSTIIGIKPSLNVTLDLLNIALFDFWIANEDRNANNANLMFDLEKSALISIDYGCIFNTAMYDYPMSPLTSTDTILTSELYHYLKKGYATKIITNTFINNLSRYFKSCIKRSKQTSDVLLKQIPTQWNVPEQVVTEKVAQLFDSAWASSVWDNFLESFIDNTK